MDHYSDEHVSIALQEAASVRPDTPISSALIELGVPDRLLEIGGRLAQDQATAVGEVASRLLDDVWREEDVIKAQEVLADQLRDVAASCADVSYLRGLHMGLLLERCRIFEIAFQCAGASIGVAMQDHPDYVMPDQRVKAAVEDILRDFGLIPEPPEENATNGQVPS